MNAMYGHQHDSGSEQTDHDGVVRCALCTHAEPGADYDWCPASEGVICDSCCNALTSGNPQRLLEASVRVGEPVNPLRILQACTSCPRLIDRVQESVLDELDGELPLN